MFFTIKSNYLNYETKNINILIQILNIGRQLLLNILYSKNLQNPDPESRKNYRDPRKKIYNEKNVIFLFAKYILYIMETCFHCYLDV